MFYFIEDPTDIIEGMTVTVLYGQGREGKGGTPYQAKVVSIKIDPDLREWIFYVHYCGWSNRYDEWINRKRIIKINVAPIRRGKPKKPEPPNLETVIEEASENNSNNNLTSNRKTTTRGSEASIIPTPTTSTATPVSTTRKETSKVESAKQTRTRHESSTSLRSETKGPTKAAEGDKRVSQRGRQASESLRERAASMSAGITSRLKGDEQSQGLTSKRIRTTSSSKSEVVQPIPPLPSPTVTTRREKEKRQQNNNKLEEQAATTTAATVGAGSKTRNKSKETNLQKEKTSEKLEKGSTSKTNKGRSGDDKNEKIAAGSKTTKITPSNDSAEGSKKENKRGVSKENDTPTKKKRSAEEPSSAMKKRAEGKFSNDENKQQPVSKAASSAPKSVPKTTEIVPCGDDTFEFVDDEDMGSDNVEKLAPIITTKSSKIGGTQSAKTPSKDDTSTTTGSNKKSSKEIKLDFKGEAELKLSIQVEGEIIMSEDNTIEENKSDENKEKSKVIILKPTSNVTSITLASTEITATTTSAHISTANEKIKFVPSKIIVDGLTSENSTISMQSAGGEDLEVQHILASGSSNVNNNITNMPSATSNNNPTESITSGVSSDTADVTSKTTEEARPKKASEDLGKDFNDAHYNDDIDLSPVNLVMAQVDEEEEEEIEEQADKQKEIDENQKNPIQVEEAENTPQVANSKPEEKTTPAVIEAIKPSIVMKPLKPTESSTFCFESSAPCSPPLISADRFQQEASLLHPLPSQIERPKSRSNLEIIAEPNRLDDSRVADLSLPNHTPQSEPITTKFGMMPTTIPSGDMYYDPVSKQLIYKGPSVNTSLSANNLNITVPNNNNHLRPVNDPYHHIQQQKPSQLMPGDFYSAPSLHSPSSSSSPAGAITTRNSKLNKIFVPEDIASTIMNMKTKSEEQQASLASSTQPVVTDQDDNANDADDDDDDDDDCQTMDDGEEDNDADDEDNNGNNIASGRHHRRVDERMVLLKSKNALGRKRRLVGRSIGSKDQVSPSNVGDGMFSSQESSQDGEVDEDEEDITETQNLTNSVSKRGRDTNIQAGDGTNKSNEYSSSGGGDGKEDEETKKKANEKEFASPMHSPSKKRRRGRARTPSESNVIQTTSLSSKEKDKNVGCKTRGNTQIISFVCLLIFFQT